MKAFKPTAYKCVHCQRISVFLSLIFALICSNANAQKIFVDNSQSPQQLIEELVDGCVEISNVTSNTNGSVNGITSYAYFERDQSAFPFESGIMLSTGNATSGGNTVNDNILNEGEPNWGTDPDLEAALGITNTLNATTIEFDFISISNLIQFNYILASEEYFGNFPCEYSDGFAFLIREVGSGAPYQNIALVPGTNIPVNTNTIHDEIVGFCPPENAAFFDGNGIGDTNYNGRTTILTASANITPNVQYHIKLVIADQTDENYDSAVFIQANSFNPTVNLGPDVTTCSTSYDLDANIENPLAVYAWFRDDILIIEETDPTITVTTSGTYKSVITIPISGEDCIVEDEVVVILESEQTAEALPDLIQCDDISGDGSELFDLNVQDSVITNMMPPANYSITYHFTESAAQNGTAPIFVDIPNASNPQTIYVRILDLDSGCLAFTQFDLIVNPLPNISTPADQQFCDDQSADGSIAIDLDLNDAIITGGNTDYTVTYHTSQIDADSGTNPIALPYVNTLPNETIYVSVVDTNTGCIATTSFEIEVLENPDVSNIDLPPLDACEQDGDGFEMFDLTEVLPDILGQIPDAIITFHESLDDAQQGINTISDPSNFENTIGNIQTLHVRIEDPNTGCASIIPLILHTNLLNTSITTLDFSECDDESGDGVEDFELSAIAVSIANNIPDLTITFYETQNDLDNSVNPIDTSVPYTVFVSPTILFVHIISPTCERELEISLTVNPPLLLSPIEPQNYCDTNQDGFINIYLPKFNEIVTEGNPDYSATYFLTEEDAIANTNQLQTSHNNLTNPQNYFVRVVNNTTGCYDTNSFEVTVIPAPDTNILDSIIICDNDQDGFSVLDLTIVESDVIDSTSDVTITYHNEESFAIDNINAITNVTSYETESNTIYIRVENNITSCFSVEPLEIIVNTLPVIPPVIEDFNYCEAVTDDLGEFIFEEKDDEILNGQIDKEVLYFETLQDAIDRTNIIDKTAIYENTSNPQQIFIRVENTSDENCFDTSSFTLQVGSLPIFTPPTNQVRCDDISNDGVEEFDFNEKITEINSGTTESLTITFHESFEDASDAVNSLPLIYNNIVNPQQIYVRIENGTFCHAIAEFGLNVIQAPLANLPSPQFECDVDYDGSTTFDLTISEIEILDVRDDDIQITYYETEEDLEDSINTIGDPENYTNSSNPQIVFVKVENVLSGCFLSIPLELNVNLPPLINDLPIIETCESEDSSFILDEATDLLIDDLDDVIINYYTSLTDAQNQNNQLADIYFYSTDNDPLFIRATYSSTGCYAIHTFNLFVNPNPIANQAPDLEGCDDDYDFELEFDLEQQTAIILGTQSGLDYTVTYHELMQEAESGINQITDLIYNAYDGQEIYARVEDNNKGCFTTTSFFTIVQRKPVVDFGDQVICLDNLPLTVSADTGFAGDTYSWSTGDNTPIVIITEIGEYSVTVTTSFGCVTTHTFNVIESELANIEFTETVDFSDPNNITITVSGIGDYLYQLDNGEPQESNIFYNVSLGYHTITVIDLNGCGSVSSEVLVIDAPKFFTPNNDGYWDTWHIVGVETLPGTTITIFDRYGKTLHNLTSSSQGWDGTYNGHRMPSNDYWFVAKVVSGNEIFEVKGHFALRR